MNAKGKAELAERKELTGKEKKAFKDAVKKKTRRILVLGIILVLGTLLFLKYFNFFGSNINSLLGIFRVGAVIPTLQLLLPLGISFYTLGETQRGSLKELIAYLKASKARVLFLMVPQALSEKMVTFLNSLKDLVEAEGFPCLDLLNGIEDTHLSLTGDFKDKKHTNVHGAIKFSGCLTDYLVANYGFTDKRGQAGWESWEQVTDYYKEVISPYTLPFEREYEPRSYGLAAPKMTLSMNGLTADLTWEPIEGADGYRIYRKTGNGDWTLAGDTDLLTPAFAENGLEAGTRYAYTVVPVTNAGGVTSYGCFSYKGISKTTEGTPASDDPGSGMAFEEP